MSNERPLEAQMSADALYREDIFTDQRVGTVRRMTPVKSDGSDDPSRPLIFVGQATVMTPMGSLPLSFELPAKTLAEAVSQFGAAAQHAIDDAARELQELRRQAASSIVIPEAGAASLKGMGGKGGIQIP
ncbi:MAG TPA: hypothetical protein VJL86_04970 [Steroidobacteraceae bacterium]|nr:hypothetical protein [Steroidobacteraceae bacterium]